MKIRLLVPRSGAAGAQDRGAVIDVSDAEGARMIAAGQAAPIKRAKPAETATAKPAAPETAAR